jgi:hypothetical protein
MTRANFVNLCPVLAWLLAASPLQSKPLAAPPGPALDVARAAFAEVGQPCGQISRAVRLKNGQVHATCDGAGYLVFVQDGYNGPVVIGCAAARDLRLRVSCRPGAATR